MAEQVPAPRHDFLLTSLMSEGWIPGVSWQIQSQAGNRPTNYTMNTGPQRVAADRLPNLSGGSASLPGAASVSGTTNYGSGPVRFSGMGSGETPEEGELRMVGRMFGANANRLRGKATRGAGTRGSRRTEGSASEGTGIGRGRQQSGRDSYMAGGDNIVGSTVVSDGSGLNYGYNAGVVGGGSISNVFLSGVGVSSATKEPKAPAASTTPTPAAKPTSTTKETRPSATAKPPTPPVAPSIKPVGDTTDGEEDTLDQLMNVLMNDDKTNTKPQSTVGKPSSSLTDFIPPPGAFGLGLIDRINYYGQEEDDNSVRGDARPLPKLVKPLSKSVKPLRTGLPPETKPKSSKKSTTTKTKAVSTPKGSAKAKGPSKSTTKPPKKGK